MSELHRHKLGDECLEKVVVAPGLKDNVPVHGGWWKCLVSNVHVHEHGQRLHSHLVGDIHCGYA